MKEEQLKNIKKQGIKLFYVSGLRHNAVVIAKNADEAINLAIKEYESEKKELNSRVLYGSVGEWESPEAQEIKLPENFRIMEK